MLVQAIDTHSLLGTAKDRQWIDLALSFLGSYVEDLGQDLLMQDADRKAYVESLVLSLREAVSLAESGKCSYHMNPTVNV